MRKNFMKKVVAGMLTAVMAFSLTACGGGDASTNDTAKEEGSLTMHSRNRRTRFQPSVTLSSRMLITSYLHRLLRPDGMPFLVRQNRQESQLSLLTVW